MVSELEARYRARSLWLDGFPGSLDAAPGAARRRRLRRRDRRRRLHRPLDGVLPEARTQPDLRIAVVEREIAGFGPSGRNGGWVSARRRRAAPPPTARPTTAGDAVARAIAPRRTPRSTRSAAVVAAEGIDCGFLKGGIAVRRDQRAAARAAAGRLPRGARRSALGEDDMRLLEPPSRTRRARRGLPAASFSPHGARVDPARLARGLAEACERLRRHDLRAHRRARARAGRVRCAGGTVRADIVLRRDRVLHHPAARPSGSATCRSTR